MKDEDQLNLILDAIGKDWTTYFQIWQKLKTKISIGAISKIIHDNLDSIKDKIEWDAEVYGTKLWQVRMKYRKISPKQ